MAANPSQAVTAPGNAPIVKTGQTTNGQFGSNPNAKAKGRGTTTELNVK